MALTEYLRVLRRWGWILIVAAALTAGAAYALSALQTPVWRSTILVSIEPSRPDLGLTQSTKTLLRNYVLRIDSEEFAQDVINLLELDRSAADLKSDVTIASDDSRLAIQIDAKHTDPAMANRIAETWALLVQDWRNVENAEVRREDKVDAVPVMPPRVSLYRPNKSVNTLAGGLLGLLLGGALIFGLEYVASDIIRSRSDVERVLPQVPVLGSIPPDESRRPAPAGRG
jgi:capsular polysaccharide biosynthesis protein